MPKRDKINKADKIKIRNVLLSPLGVIEVGAIDDDETDIDSILKL